MSNDYDTESKENKRFSGTSEWWTTTPDNVEMEVKESNQLPDELKPLLKEIEDLAKNVAAEFVVNDFDTSDITIEINENSPYLSHSYNWRDSDIQQEEE